jgi:hypothetical protein
LRTGVQIICSQSHMYLTHMYLYIMLMDVNKMGITTYFVVDIIIRRN